MVYGVAYFGFFALTFLLTPKLWRPDLPFGMSVHDQEGREMGARALRYWNRTILSLSACAGAGAVLLDLFFPHWWARLTGVAMYFVLAALIYMNARKMLRPFSPPSAKAGAILLERRYRDYLSPWWEALPLALFALGTVLAWSVLFKASEAGLKFHANSLTDLWVPERVSTLGSLIFCLLAFYPLACVTNVLMAYSKQSFGSGDPEVSLAADQAFRRMSIRLGYAARVWIMAQFPCVMFCIGLRNHGAINSLGPVRSVILAGFAALVLISFILSLSYGQGGWRWAVRKGLVSAKEAPSALDGDGMADRCWKLGYLYFNPNDPSILVQRRFGAGWTLNLGSMWGVSLFVATLLICFWPAIMHALAGK
jgi:uncharacterized membrane protein